MQKNFFEKSDLDVSGFRESYEETWNEHNSLHWKQKPSAERERSYIHRALGFSSIE